MSYLYEIYENPFLKTKTNSHTQAKKIAKFGKKKTDFSCGDGAESTEIWYIFAKDALVIFF